MNESPNQTRTQTKTAIRKPSTTAHLPVEDPMDFDLKVAEAYSKHSASRKNTRIGIEMMSFVQQMIAH